MSDDLVTRARRVAAAAPPPFADDSTQWTEAAYYAIRDLADALEAARDAINDGRCTALIADGPHWFQRCEDLAEHDGDMHLAAGLNVAVAADAWLAPRPLSVPTDKGSAT